MINDNKVKIHRKFGIEESDYYELLIDGYIVEETNVVEIQILKFGQQVFCVFSHELASSNKMASLEIGEFIKANVLALSFGNWTEIGNVSINIEIEFDVDTEKTHLQFQLLADLLLWSRNYTFIDYFHEFERLLNVNEVGELSNDDVGNNINIKIEIPLENKVISEEINLYLKKIIETHYETLNNLDSAYSDNSILATFNFPKEIKTSCEQYLLYFAQFLEDLGINATPNLKEEAGKVLFSVTPTDDIEALDKIREALAVYLNLPSSPIVYDDSFAAMRLHQQIDNLQHSQRMAEREIRSAERELRLAQTVIESQDKVIVQKDTLIEQQTKVIDKITSKSIMMDSLDNKEELEEIFEGLKIGKSKFLMEQLGVHLNPATALKTVGKKILGKDERKSILGLDEETDKEDY